MPVCALCERDVPYLTEHHLIPRSKGKRGQELPVVDLCSACHRQLHVLYTNDELARVLNTVERIRDEPRMQRFLKWIRKQPPERYVTVRR